MPGMKNSNIQRKKNNNLDSLRKWLLKKNFLDSIKSSSIHINPKFMKVSEVTIHPNFLQDCLPVVREVVVSHKQETNEAPRNITLISKASIISTNITTFENIKTLQQSCIYKSYFNNAYNMCKQLLDGISAYTKQLTYLACAVESVPKNSKSHKILKIQLCKAYKCYKENPAHSQCKILHRQLKLLVLLIQKFNSKIERKT